MLTLKPLDRQQLLSNFRMVKKLLFSFNHLHFNPLCYYEKILEINLPHTFRLPLRPGFYPHQSLPVRTSCRPSAATPPQHPLSPWQLTSSQAPPYLAVAIPSLHPASRDSVLACSCPSKATKGAIQMLRNNFSGKLTPTQ